MILTSDAMQIVRESARRLAALAACCILPGCEAWPPHSDDLVDYVRDRSSQVETLVSEFRDSPLGRITCNGCGAGNSVSGYAIESHVFVNGAWRRADNPRDGHFARLLEDAGVYGVTKRSNGPVELLLAEPGWTDASRFIIQLFHDAGSGASNALKECVSDFDEIECGWCKVTVDDALWIRYQWYPEDLDPAATEAHLSGEISWEEWRARDEAAEEACLRRGLAEMGYPVDDE
ncbi:MAG: hypothetical protein R3176_12480 [Woeseiaceae bacterium]|nr:hypothetical protein [Woeseiaceae bacterium]